MGYRREWKRLYYYLLPRQMDALALQLKGVIAARAKANMSRGGQGYQKSDNPVHTLKELSAAADVSHGTLHKVEAVERDAPEPVKVAASWAVHEVTGRHGVSMRLPRRWCKRVGFC